MTETRGTCRIPWRDLTAVTQAEGQPNRSASRTRPALCAAAVVCSGVSGSHFFGLLTGRRFCPFASPAGLDGGRRSACVVDLGCARRIAERRFWKRGQFERAWQFLSLYLRCKKQRNQREMFGSATGRNALRESGSGRNARAISACAELLRALTHRCPVSNCNNTGSSSAICFATANGPLPRCVLATPGQDDIVPLPISLS
jgi:hypothetical protein